MRGGGVPTALTATALVLASLTAVIAGLPGGLSAPDGTSADAGTASSDLTREDLESGRVTVDPSATDWASFRLVLTDRIWEDRDPDPDEVAASATIVYLLESEPGSETYMMDGVWFNDHVPDEDPFPDEDPVWINTRAYGDAGRVAGWLSIFYRCSGCADEVPPVELLWIPGTVTGRTVLHLGMGGHPDDLGDRPRLGVAPDHRGDHGTAGMFWRTVDEVGAARTYSAGQVEYTESVGEEGPSGVVVDHAYNITASAPMPVRGTATLWTAMREHPNAWQWHYRADLDPLHIDRGGAMVSPMPGVGVGVNDVRVRFGEPRLIVQQATEPGTAAIDVGRQLTGRQGDPVLLSGTSSFLSWGWVGADLEDLYDWPSPDRVVADGGAEVEPGGPDAWMTHRSCVVLDGGEPLCRDRSRGLR